ESAHQAVGSRHYSLTKPLPIVGRERRAESAIERTPLLGQVPAGLLAAQVGASPDDPARIRHDAPIDQGEAVQGRPGLDLAAADAGAKRLRTRRCQPPSRLPLPLAGSSQNLP